jgi:hypothetical protein
MKRMLAVFLLISFVGCGTLMGTVKISPLSQDSYSEIVLAEENKKMAMDFGIMQAPTAVVIEGSNIRKHTGVSEIKAYAENMYA